MRSRRERMANQEHWAQVGDYVIAQAFQMTGEALPRAAIVEFASPEVAQLRCVR